MEKGRQSVSLVKNSIYKGLLNIFNLIVPIVTIPYIYRVLSPEAMGNFEYANTLFCYFNLCGALGIYTYGIREISRIRDDSEKVNEIYSSLFSIGIFSNLFVCGIFVALAFGVFHDTPLFRLMLVFSLSIIANIFYTEWINEAFEDFRFITIKTAIIRLLYVAAIFLVIKTPDDLWKYAALIVVSNFLNYICSFIYSKRYTHFKLLSIRFSRYDLQKYLPALFFILILKNSTMFYTVLDRIMLGSFEGSQSVAYYSVGQRIMEMIRALLITITYVSLPRLSYYLSNDVSLYRDNLQKLVRVGFLLSLPLSVGLCLLGKDIVTLFAGEQYLAAVYPLSVFAVRIVTLLIENITATQILFLHNREKIVVIINIVWGIGNLVCNYFLFRWGVLSPMTAILSTLCMEFGVLVTEFYYIKRYLHIQVLIFCKQTLRYFFFALLFVPVTYGIKHYSTNEWLSFALSIISCIMLYSLCLHLSKDEIFQTIVQKVKNIVVSPFMLRS